MHPYRQKLENSLKGNKDFLLLLHRKIYLLQAEGIHLFALEEMKLSQIEANINLKETQDKAKALSQVVCAKQAYFDRFIIQLEKDQKDMNTYYDIYLKKSIEIGFTDQEVKEFIGSIDYIKGDTDIEHKIKVFKELKKIATASRK